MLSLSRCRVGMIGLGYVVLSPAVESGKHYDTIGFDINALRVKALRAGHDATRETTHAECVLPSDRDSTPNCVICANAVSIS